jgi:hypothetical protein
MTNEVAAPKCPECKISGLEHIVSQDSDQKGSKRNAWFQVVSCDECGHIYGVFAKTVNAVSGQAFK